MHATGPSVDLQIFLHFVEDDGQLRKVVTPAQSLQDVLEPVGVIERVVDIVVLLEQAKQ